MSDICFEKRTCPTLGEVYYEATHPSGLRVLVCPKDLSAYYATVGVRYGSMDLPDGQGKSRQTYPIGVAHFLEHKLFEKADGGDADADFASIGAEVNAFTSYDRTAYLFSCTDRFDEALAHLLCMVSDLTVTDASVARERDIIAEEIRMNADSPWERCYAEMLRALYHSHRVREEICGSEASIGRITPAVLRRIFDAFYTPANMVLAVSGRVIPEAVMAVVDACLPAEKTPPPPPMRPFKEPTAVARERVSVGMQAAKPLFCIGIKDGAVPEGAREILRRDLLMTVLCEMLFSRSGDFYSDLFESGLVSPGMSYGSSVGRGFGFYALSGEADDPDAVMAAFRAYIDRLHTEGLPEEEFERSRRILYADYVTGFDSTEDVASSLCNYALEGVELFDFLPIVEDMTFSEVCALFDDTFREGHYVLSVVEPQDGNQNEDIKEEKEGK